MRDPRFLAGDDPGDPWVDAVLEPLRRLDVRCDVVPAVMARVAVSPSIRKSWISSDRVPRLIWASCGLAAVAAIAFLAFPVIGLVRQGAFGTAQARGIVNAVGHLGGALGGQVRMLMEPAFAAAMPVLKAIVTLAVAAAPICKSAGAIAALTGVLSILISLYIFAQARGAAPPTESRGRLFFHGGIR